MSTTLPKPRARTLYLPEQVNQESMNKLTKAIIDVNKSDDYLKKLYGINDIEYVPKPLRSTLTPMVALFTSVSAFSV